MYVLRLVWNIRKARATPTLTHVLYTFSACTHNAVSHSKWTAWPWGEQMYVTSRVTLNSNTYRERTGEFGVGLVFGSWHDRISNRSPKIVCKVSLEGNTWPEFRLISARHQVRPGHVHYNKSEIQKPLFTWRWS